MPHSRFAVTGLALAVALAIPAGARSAPAKPSQAAVFSAGHWKGHGWFSATHAPKTQNAPSAESDGSFTFDLTVGVQGIVVGRMVIETSGQAVSPNAVAKFEEISTGNGWVLGGTAESVTWTGTETVTGTITGTRVAMTVPINSSIPARGHFEPQQATCNTASGDLALPMRQSFAAGANPSENSIIGPWVAFKVDGAEGLKEANDNADQWFDVMGQMDKATEDDFKGMSAAQLKALIERAKQVQAAIAGFQKCGSGAPGLSSQHSKNEFTIFGIEIQSAENALAKIGGHF
jgi:hypothetical protein